LVTHTANPQAFPVRFDGRYGYLDESLDVVSPPAYMTATEYADGLAVVEVRRGVFRIIDHQGEQVAAFEANRAYAPSDGMIRFEDQGVYGFLDYQGTPRLRGYDLAMDFSEGKAFVRQGNRKGYIDKAGAWLFPHLSIDGGAAFKDGRARVWQREDFSNKTYGYIDSQGRYIIPLKYHDLDDFSEGRAAAGFGRRERSSRAQRYGYIGLDGKIVIEPIFFDAKSFKHEVALVQYRPSRSAAGPHDHYMIIDRSGETVSVLDEELEILSNFRGGLALIGQISERRDAVLKGFIDTTGEVVYEPRLMDVVSFKTGYWILSVYENRAPQTLILDPATLHQYDVATIFSTASQ
jgi:hypothetical protein